MSLARIEALLAYALPFALRVSGAYALIRLGLLRLRIRRPAREALLLLFVFYLSALLAVTAVRGSMAWSPGGGPRGNWTPFATTFSQWRAGAWPFAYHVFGNTLWFMPLGLLLPRLWRRWTFWNTALAGLMLSAAIEAAQRLFATGIPDIDDVLMNTLGAMLGYGAHMLVRRGKSPAA